MSMPNRLNNYKTVRYLGSLIQERVPDGEVGDGRDDVNVHTQEPVEGEEGDVQTMASQVVAQPW